MKTTLNEIRKHSPGTDGWQKLLAHLGKTAADDEPLSITTVVESNGVTDALRCLRAVTGHDREIRLYACWCARQVWHLLTDERSRTAVDVAERFANGEVGKVELSAARSAACSAGWSAARSAASSAACSAASSAASSAISAGWYAARSAAWYAACSASSAAVDAQASELRRVCEAIDAGIDPYPKQKETV